MAMTMIEWVCKNRAFKMPDDYIGSFCPSDYGFPDLREEGICVEDCEICWKRPVPKDW